MVALVSLLLEYPCNLRRFFRISSIRNIDIVWIFCIFFIHREVHRRIVLSLVEWYS